MENTNHINSELTDAEAELYDRQIRLWGLESQKRLRAADILLIGLGGLGAEVAKNIILAGIRSITFLDHENLTRENNFCQFLASKSSVGLNRAQESVARAQNLNPMVKVTADPQHVDDKPEEYFKQFSVVCATRCTLSQIERINNICRKFNIKFLVGDVWGTFGYCFNDLNTHEFVEDIVQYQKVKIQEAGNIKEKFENVSTTVKRKEQYVPFESVLCIEKLPKDGEDYCLFQALINYREKYNCDPTPDTEDKLREEAKTVFENYGVEMDKFEALLNSELYYEISPACAIVGGVMAQEVIKAVSQKDTPHNNLFIFNPLRLCGRILKLGY